MVPPTALLLHAPRPSRHLGKSVALSVLIHLFAAVFLILLVSLLGSTSLKSWLALSPSFASTDPRRRIA